MTPELLARAASIPLDRANRWVVALNNALGEYQVSSSKRIAAFLAQVGHESGGFLYVRELWGPTPAQSRYEGRLDLGNTQKGDGFKYRGRGLIQTTGRANYRVTGQALGLPLEDQPELLEQQTNAARSAGWYWRTHGCNELADVDRFLEITKRINGGTNGQVDRMTRWEVARRELGVPKC